MTEPIKGGCQCGAVTFRAKPPSKFCLHCHCRFCRKAHGAPVVTWLGVYKEGFEVQGDSLSWYASSRQSRRGYCRECGTMMFYTSALCPGEVHVALAVVDSGADREPAGHIFYDQRMKGVEFGDDLPKIDTDDERLEKFRAVE